jgi:hypothetical protein
MLFGSFHNAFGSFCRLSALVFVYVIICISTSAIHTTGVIEALGNAKLGRPHMAIRVILSQ